MQDSRPPGGETPPRHMPDVLGPEGLRKTRSAMGVAFALLDELLQLLPERPDADALKEIEDVLRELRDLAQAGLKFVKVATGVIESPDVPGNGTG